MTKINIKTKMTKASQRLLGLHQQTRAQLLEPVSAGSGMQLIGKFGLLKLQSEETEPVVLPSTHPQHRRMVDKAEDVDVKLGLTALA